MADAIVSTADGRIKVVPFGADALTALISLGAASATLSQAWAEGTEPGGSGTFSAKEYSEQAAAQVDLATDAVADGIAAVEAAGDAKVSLASGHADRAEDAEEAALGYASTAGSASVDNLFSIFSQVTVNPPETASTIQANGWEIINSAPADVSLGPVKVVRKGYSTAALPVAWVDTLYRTKRVRQAYPNQASFTATEEALSDYVYSTDFVFGLANQSTETSPKPIANWAMPDRLQVASSVHWEIVAFHRDARNYGAGGVGQQVACVRVRANNGTVATAWQTVSAASISTFVEDANPLEVFQADLDVSALADGAFWLEGEVYPWFGAAASVLKSEDQSAFREFSRRWFRKRATINYVYVASTGNDTTGVCSTTEATALATPCLTVAGALLKARTTLGTTTVGALDGLRVRIVDSVNTGAANIASFAPLRQDVAGVIVERAPGTARASAVVTISSSFRPFFSDTSGQMTEGSLIFNDVSVVLGGAFSLVGEAARKLEVQFWNCNLNWGSFATTLRSSSHLRFFGVVGSNFHSTSVAQSANGEVRIMRGLTADLNNGGFEGWVTMGCSLTRASSPGYADATKNGHICYNNTFLNPNQNSSGVLVFAGATAALNGLDLGSVAMVQNLVELLGTQGNSSMRVAGDSDFGNLTHCVIHHNTLTGTNDAGRINFSYDEHPTVARTHKLISMKAVLAPSINIKGDDYAPISNGARIGHFPAEHGVGCAGNFTKDVNALSGGPSFGQAYAGIGSVIAGGDPLYTDNQSVTKPAASLVAGVGGGTYTLQSGSPARDILAYPLLKYDIAGNARGTGTQDAGVYA